MDKSEDLTVCINNEKKEWSNINQAKLHGNRWAGYFVARSNTVIYLTQAYLRTCNITGKLFRASFLLVGNVRHVLLGFTCKKHTWHITAVLFVYQYYPDSLFDGFIVWLYWHIHTRIKLCLGNVNLCDYIFHDKILNLKYIDDADKEMS